MIESPHAKAIDEVLSALESEREQGLSRNIAETRLAKYGRNELRQAQRRSGWKILLDQFRSIVIIILVVAGVIAFATGRMAEGWALVAVTFVNTAIGFFSEWKAVRSMEALREMGKATTGVRRDGKIEEIPIEELVPGDIVPLEPETLVPADMRVIEADGLRVNEAALTGESVPVNVRTEPIEEDTPLAERVNLLFKGTSVTEGSGFAVVFATGMETELGRISELAAGADSSSTVLQRRLDDLGRRLAWIVLGVAVIVAVAGLIRGRDLVLMVETSIALGVAAVPEGLPIVATIALARGMWIMAKRNAVINQLTAVETLGATRVIFSDKTGTLTENEMRVTKIITPADTEDLKTRAIRIGVLCNNAVLDEEDEKRTTGDPTEVSLLVAGRERGFSRADLLEERPEEHEVSFDPDVMMMATFHRDGDEFLEAVKGAPGAVLEICSRIARSERGDEELADDEREQWLGRADELASEGLRLLAVAERRVESTDVEPYEALTFVGLLGLADPPRGDVRDSIEECQEAGIRVVMVTGDRPDTGQAIGEKVGLERVDAAAHGQELGDLDELSDDRSREVMETDVFARVTPEQKLELVKLYQERGEIVAMTGDGVNDAPALKQADIGIAMGKRGTDAARQASDMVLGDDAFSSIVAAVRQGRVIFANIRKSVIFMLCTNLAEVLAVTAASLAGLPIPLTPLQILFLNVLTDVFPALALGVGKGDPDVMKRPPRNSSEQVLTREHWTAIGCWSAVVAVCVLGALLIALHVLDLEPTAAVTISFLTLGFAKLWFPFNLRDRGASRVCNDITCNPWIWSAMALCTGLLLLAALWSPLNDILPTVPPTAQGWLVILGLSLLPMLLGLFTKGIRFYTESDRSE